VDFIFPEKELIFLKRLASSNFSDDRAILDTPLFAITLPALE
jgi:hypothetical protein